MTLDSLWTRPFHVVVFVKTKSSPCGEFHHAVIFKHDWFCSDSLPYSLIVHFLCWKFPVASKTRQRSNTNMWHSTESDKVTGSFFLLPFSRYFLKNDFPPLTDHVVTSLAQDIFKVIASTLGCTDALEARLVPTLVSILEAEGDKVTLGLQAVALDILQTLVRAYAPSSAGASNKSVLGSPTSQPPRPLSQLLLGNGFPAAVKCTLHSDDSAVTQVIFFSMHFRIKITYWNVAAKFLQKCRFLFSHFSLSPKFRETGKASFASKSA